jgi:hypothetical protein
MKALSGQLQCDSSSSAQRLLVVAILLSAQVACALPVVAKTPEKIKTEYRFLLSEKGPDLVFHVALDKDSVPNSVSVFRPSESKPFETMENCAYSSVEIFPTDRYPNLQLLRTADVNFDGYLDLMMVGYTNMPHLGNTFYCVWLWEPKVERFEVFPNSLKYPTRLLSRRRRQFSRTVIIWEAPKWRRFTPGRRVCWS